jgi:uncharacterized protein (DUF885 family)
MKRMPVLILLPVLAGLLIAPGRAAAGDIDSRFDNFFREWVAMNPDDASQFGLTREMGYPCAKNELSDGSERLVDETYRFYRRYADQLKRRDPKPLTPSQRLDAGILSWFLAHALKGEPYKDHAPVINQMYGVHSALVNLLTEYHTISGKQDALDWLARLKKAPQRVDQTLERLALQERRGIRPPVYVIDKVDAIMSEFAATPADSNVLLVSFAGRLEPLTDIDADRKAALRGAARDIIRDELYPAYRRFIAAVRASRARSDSLAGVWRLPQGDAYYRWCLKNHTTTELSPRQVHALGVKEVARIQSEMKALMKELDLSGGPVFSSWMNAYWGYIYGPAGRDRYTYPQAPETRDRVVADYQAIIDQTWPRLATVFSQIPRTRVDAQAVPPYKEASAGTYYEPASLDGRRQGVFYVNLGGNIPNKPGMATLAYHEAVPGHHFQIAIAQERQANRMFKNLLFFTGFGEGWAMYSEKLAQEQGWFPDAPTRIANLNSLLFRAVRLVVDTGIHSRRWTRGQAMQYMRDNLGWTHDGEVDRYIMWPGQACSYYVGMLKIIELRDKAKKQLGPKFDLREFHRILLENGTMPLALAERQVDSYIQANR